MSAPGALDAEQLRLVDAYWRAANYLSVGQIYLLDNPLLREPLSAAHVKPRLLGHWGTTPGLNLVYAHLNRVIRARGLDMIYVFGPGHGGPAAPANSWLEGSYSEVYPQVSQDEVGMRRLFRQFSFPGGVPSLVAPQTPGSIHEGGELGYSLAHAYGAAFDNPGLVVACVIGDGEAGTGPLAASWHSTTFLDPARDGAVLPVLCLNGYKIASPTVLARIPYEELVVLLRGWGHRPYLVRGDDPAAVHQQLAQALDAALNEIAVIQRVPAAACWPSAPRGRPSCCAPQGLDRAGHSGRPAGGGRPAGAPGAAGRGPGAAGAPGRAGAVAALLPGSYRRRSCSTSAAGRCRSCARCRRPARPGWAPTRAPTAACCCARWRCPSGASTPCRWPKPGTASHEPTSVLGGWLRDVLRDNPDRFRLFGPDETASNRLSAVFEATDRAWNAEVWNAEVMPTDEHLARGRVMEVLSEHLCQGWLEGYVLTGRHGLFGCYEAFAHIVDAMLNQHAKWLKVAREIPWRRPVASLNYLLTSHVWRQDHNGFTHQDPDFLDHVLNKKAEVTRVYLPPDTNTLLSVADHCLRSRDYVNVVVVGKQPVLDLFGPEEAYAHCVRGLGALSSASSDAGADMAVLA